MSMSVRTKDLNLFSSDASNDRAVRFADLSHRLLHEHLAAESAQQPVRIKDLVLVPSLGLPLLLPISLVTI